ncbi:uncharacterized protein [Triticum aestivum]|uniref:uncharacterized protein n=1 Tax=Triticum aestivum TaxID=4565 RepID=UPI001D00E348|nr:uncharacterized protein LOC123178117 [Triticum aestivum]
MPEDGSASAIAEFNHEKELARRQHARDRSSNMANEPRDRRNAQRRASYRKKKEEGTINLQNNNQVQRERRKEQRNNRTPDEQGESSAKRKADYARRKNTPCAESIAMPRPDLTSALSNSPSFNTHVNCPTLTLRTITQQSGSEQIYRDTTIKSAPTYIRNTETDGAYLSRTLGDGAVDGDLIEINEHLQSADLQTSDPVTIADNGFDEQSHESRARRRTRERACKGSMAAMKRQEKIGKRKTCTQVPRGERNAMLDRRNKRFVGRVNTPTVRSISIPKMSSTGQPTIVEAHSASTSSSTPEYTIRSEGNTPILTLLASLETEPSFVLFGTWVDDMDAYLNGLMNDNANPDNLFEYEYYLFAGEGMYTRLSVIHMLGVSH